MRMFNALQGLGKTTLLYMIPTRPRPDRQDTVLDQRAHWRASMDNDVKHAGKEGKPVIKITSDQEWPAGLG